MTPEWAREPQQLDPEVGEALSAPNLRVYDLGMPVDESMPQWPTAGSRRFVRSWVVAPGTDAAAPGVTFAVEAIEASLHTSTHIDAVAHAQAHGAIHGGEAVAAITADGWFRKGGVEEIPPLILPFVLLDAATAAGVDALSDDSEVTIADLVQAGAGTRLPIGAGAVLIRTGTIRSFGTGDGYLQRQPGLSVAAAVWLHDQGMTLLGTDTAGTEPLPLRDVEATVHEALLVERGVHLVENLNLEQLAAAGRTRGVFICLPVKLTGATASWVRPVAVA